MKLGMEKARARVQPIGRPVVVDKVDAAFVLRLRSLGNSWRLIAKAHPPVKSSRGKKVRPSVGSIRRAFVERQTHLRGRNKSAKAKEPLAIPTQCR